MGILRYLDEIMVLCVESLKKVTLKIGERYVKFNIILKWKPMINHRFRKIMLSKTQIIILVLMFQ